MAVKSRRNVEVVVGERVLNIEATKFNMRRVVKLKLRNRV